MPFPRLNVRFARSFGSCPREVYQEDPTTGVVSTVIEPCNKKLPDSELFEIQNQVKAGVKLDEVATNILGSGVDAEAFTSAVSTVAKKTRKTKQTKEVVDED